MAMLQFELFNLCMVTNLGEEKLWIVEHHLKIVKHHIKIDLVSSPAFAEGLVNILRDFWVNVSNYSRINLQVILLD